MENPATVISGSQKQTILLKKKVVSSAGCLSILFLQFPASTLTMTDKEIILEGSFLTQKIAYTDIERVEIKPFLDWKFTIYRSNLYGKGVKIWRKGAVPDLATLVKNKRLQDFNPQNSAVIIIKPTLILDILRQKRPDLFVGQTKVI